MPLHLGPAHRRDLHALARTRDSLKNGALIGAIAGAGAMRRAIVGDVGVEAGPLLVLQQGLRILAGGAASR